MHAVNISPDLVVLGAISGMHGVKGHVTIKLFSASESALTAYGTLCDGNGAPLPPLTVTGHTRGMVIAKMKGVDSKEDAQKIKGTQLCAPRDALPEPSEDEFYIHDLIGMEVLDAATRSPIGRVKFAHDFGAGEMLEITFTDSGKDEYHHFSNAIFPDIDLEKNTLTFQAPETLNASEDNAKKDA